MATVTKPYHSEFTDRIRAEGEALGEARGEARGEVVAMARMLLVTLESRGVRLSPTRRRLVEESTDSVQLERWFRRALTALSADDVFG